MKTNKTKPIKKIMIFTIITVMIVSLFAVPAFAATLPIPEEGFPTLPETGGYFENDFLTSGVGLLCEIAELEELLSGSAIVMQSKYIYISSYQYLCAFFDADGNQLGYAFEYDAIRYLRDDSFGTPLHVYFYNSDMGSETAIADGAVYVATYINDMDSGYPPRNFEYDDNYTPNTLSYLDICTAVRFVAQSTDPDDPTPPADGEEQGIFAVWSQITQWIVEGLASVSNAFYANGELTLLGYLCIIPLAIGVAFLLIGIIQKFLRLRG